MRLGRVQVTIGYTVDLDNPRMVKLATDAVFDDVRQVTVLGQLHNNIDAVEVSMPTADEIPSWLTEE